MQIEFKFAMYGTKCLSNPNSARNELKCVFDRIGVNSVAFVFKASSHLDCIIQFPDCDPDCSRETGSCSLVRIMMWSLDIISENRLAICFSLKVPGYLSRENGHNAMLKVKSHFTK